MDLFEAVRESHQQHLVPGVAVGVLQDGEERHEGFGVTSVDNPLEVTPDTLFQIGSVSKTFTGTVAMYLVADGLLDLDRPVREYVPDLELRDADAAARATTRHLLSHTGGWVGDYFDDTGWGDDAVARYVGRMRTLPQQTPVGELWAYNNAGFALAGRVIEVVAGKRFEDVVKERIFEPLELTSSTYWPWEVMTERFAVGHMSHDGKTEVARPWPVGRSAHPAGGITSTTRDLLRYARLHLDPPPELAPMQEPQAPAAGEGEWVGLAWYGEESFRTIRHGGGTNGQLCVLVLQPSTGYALAVLTNGSPGGLQVLDAALGAAGFKKPEPEPITGAPIDRYTGVYEAPGSRLKLSSAGERMKIEIEPLGGFPTPDSPPGPAPAPTEAFFFTDDRWLVDDGAFKGTVGHFIRDDGGDVVWLRVSGRLYQKMPA
ncbi:MAG TPA: serine hydrolase domain-containing protein [Gaiellaceae bacterium]|nr:serine hydrolase domain-containing protein [Gaiellaceae bacterium]